MFFSAYRLPSFAPEDPPSHASKNQITTGLKSYHTKSLRFPRHHPQLPFEMADGVIMLHTAAERPERHQGFLFLAKVVYYRNELQ